MATRRLILTGAVTLSVLALAAIALGQTSQATVQHGYIEPHPAVQSPLLEYPPPAPDSYCEECAGRLHVHEQPTPIPSNPRIRSGELQPMNPPTDLLFAPPGGFLRGQRDPGTFTLFENHLLTDAETNSGGGFVNEPSFGVNGRAIMWTGNWYASVSGDYGQSFSYIDPGDNFPADGQPDLVGGGGYCCDQIVYYERTRGATFWLLLYHVPEGGNTNFQRIAVANSQADVVNNNWFWYDFTPANYGFPGSYWLDFPYLTVSQGYLYHVTKLLDWVPPPEEHEDGEATDEDRIPSTRTLIARYPLDAISQGQSFNYDYYIVHEHGARPTHGAATTMYIPAHIDNGEMRIYVWPDGSNTIYWDDIDHNGFNEGTNVAPGPDGRDWSGHIDNWILGAWVADGVIGTMFGACQGGGFPYPHVQVLRFDQVTRELVSQGQVWSTSLAWLFPSVHPNNRGHLGGTIVYGGGNYYPGAAAWIADDYNGGQVTPMEAMAFAVGNSGPEDNRWGDYLTARRNSPYGYTWGGSGFSLNGGPTHGFTEARYVWFGRERDWPPPAHTIYVDHANTSTWEDGSSSHPYNTVTEGHHACVAGDWLKIRDGNYPEAVWLTTEVEASSEGGTAIIGQ